MKSFVVERWSKILTILRKKISSIREEMSVVECWSRVFKALRHISLFQIVPKSVREKPRFVEVWVVAFLLLSVIFLRICSAPNLRWWEAFAVGLGVLRVWEVVIYQINVLLFDEYRARKKEYRLRKLKITYVAYAIRGYRRIVVLLLHNYVESIFWFALFYRNLDWAFQTSRVSLNSFFGALNFSFVTMTTFGYTTIFPKETWADVVTLIQSAIGLFMALLILARFISFLPKPETLDEFER